MESRLADDEQELASHAHYCLQPKFELPPRDQGLHSRRRQKKLTAQRRRQQNPSGEVLEFWAIEDEQDFAIHAHYVLYPKVELPLWPMASFVWSRNEPS